MSDRNVVRRCFAVIYLPVMVIAFATQRDRSPGSLIFGVVLFVVGGALLYLVALQVARHARERQAHRQAPEPYVAPPLTRR